MIAVHHWKTAELLRKGSSSTPRWPSTFILFFRRALLCGPGWRFFFSFFSEKHTHTKTLLFQRAAKKKNLEESRSEIETEKINKYNKSSWGFGFRAVQIDLMMFWSLAQKLHHWGTININIYLLKFLLLF